MKQTCYHSDGYHGNNNTMAINNTMLKCMVERTTLPLTESIQRGASSSDFQLFSLAVH